jgi:gag-polypeptide of LTR copia-type
MLLFYNCYKMLMHTKLSYQIYTMLSSNAVTLVPILDGTNYGIWAKAMQAFLMSIGLWKYAMGNDTKPPLDADGATAHATWEKERAQCIGNVVLRTTAPIQQKVSAIQDPKMLWNHILALYGAVTLTSIYKEFRTVTTMTFNLAQHPAPQLDKMQATFSHLLASSMPVPDPMQGLILLNRVPNHWEHLIPIIMQNFDVNVAQQLAQHTGLSTHLGVIDT